MQAGSCEERTMSGLVYSKLLLTRSLTMYEKKVRLLG